MVGVMRYWIYFASPVICLHSPQCFASGSAVFLSSINMHKGLPVLIKMLLKTAFFHLFIEADYIVFELCLN